MRPSIAFLLLAPLALVACDRKKPEQSQAQPAAATPAGAEAHQVDRAARGQPIPAMPLIGPDGAPATLSSLRGAPVLVNLWATWCGPCVKELPQLDALAAQVTPRVVAISEDMEGTRAIAPFLAAHPLKTLKPWLDKDGKLLAALKEGGLPLTILYGADGKERWRVRGGLDWTGAEAKALLAETATGHE